MSLSKKTERSFQIIEAASAINVQWTDIIMEDGEEISRKNRNTGYGKGDRVKFLLDCPDCVQYADLAGLVESEDDTYINP